MQNPLEHPVVKEVIHSAPPVVVTASGFMGVTFQNWVYIFTAIYTLVQIIRALPKALRCIACFVRNIGCPGTCKTVLAAFLLVGLLAGGSQAADLHKAMYGWTASSGTHFAGILAMEGVSKKNPLGRQNLKSDPGNFRTVHGKRVNCGGTLAGICCRDNPRFPFKTATIEDVVRHYGNDQWKAIRGDEIISQYLAYKLCRMAILMGTETAIILLEKTINDLNGKEADFPLHGTLTAAHVKWLNEFTAPQTLVDGGESHWRRWCFFSQLKLNALDRCGDLIAKNPKLRVFWDTWSEQTEYDR